MLGDCFPGQVDGTSWVVVLPSVHPGFCQWWAEQLVKLRVTGWDLTVHILVLAENLPCSWSVMSLLRGTRLDANHLETFRSHITCFEPSVRTSFSDGISNFCVLKKIRGITFKTVPFIGACPTVPSRWQQPLVPPFRTSPRLIVDYSAEDSFQMLGLLQVWAHRIGADIPIGGSRSFASTKLSSRRMCALHLDGHSGYSMEDLQQMIQSDLADADVRSAAVGQECLFMLPQETYMLTFNDSSWLQEGTVTDILSDVVFVSPYKAIVRLKSCATIDHFKISLDSLGSTRINVVRQLLDHQANKLWPSEVLQKILRGSRKVPKRQKTSHQVVHARIIRLEEHIDVDARGLPSNNNSKRPTSIATRGAGRF